LSCGVSVMRQHKLELINRHWSVGSHPQRGGPPLTSWMKSSPWLGSFAKQPIFNTTLQMHYQEL